ncbi:GNAT family N-acetyltransferase [Terrabacter sp. NPDC000476]|uniref:GNAT family N-acetyltransferase n=1 Tax=Terrabacter sp. NPDC000476 TaxID=3154258 RepID=UPI00331DF668
MVPSSHGRLRSATIDDGPRLIHLWALLFDEDTTTSGGCWRAHASTWFARCVADPSTARFAVVDVDDQVVATAIGTLELGVPNPQCPRGRLVRLANVITHPTYRGSGFGSLVVDDVTRWARSIDADRVDLSATPEGQRLYARAGFVPTSAPRMKLVL